MNKRQIVFPMGNGNQSQFNELDNLFNDVIGNLFNNKQLNPMYPPVDIYDKETNFYFEIMAAGLDKEDIEIKIEENKMKITGKKREVSEEELVGRHYHHKSISKKGFEKAFDFNLPIDNVIPKLDKGILYLEVLLMKPEKKERVIDFK